LAKKRTKDNIIDGIAVTYISRLLKTEESFIDKITDNEEDILLVVEQASRKRLNRKKLLELHPKLASLLMVFKEGTKLGLDRKQLVYLSDIFYEYFFCLNKAVGNKKLNFVGNKPSERGSKICLILTIFYSEVIESYCEQSDRTPDYKKTKTFYDEYIKNGFKNCEINVNLDNFIEVLETIRDKYIKK
jgi:hypothetical protein